MEGRLDVETSNRPCGRISRSLAFAATGKGEAWTRHSKGPKPLRRTPMSNSPTRRERPPVLNPLNRRIRTRMSGGVGGGSREVSPYPDWAGKSNPDATILSPDHAARIDFLLRYDDQYELVRDADLRSDVECCPRFRQIANNTTYRHIAEPDQTGV